MLASKLSPIVSLGEDGLAPFEMTLREELEAMHKLNDDDSLGAFAATWTDILGNSLNQTDELTYLLNQSPVDESDFLDSDLAKRFTLIAQMIVARNKRRVNRDHFYVTFGGFDAHSDMKERLDEKFDTLNAALNDLVTALKEAGVWNGVVIVQTSDFGRTLTPSSNGNGSDHGWGGNYWMAGGALRSSTQMIGKFPDSLAEGNELDIGRGRLIPTTSWDSIFNGIAEWMGPDTESDLNAILPNRNRFPGDLYGASNLFKTAVSASFVAFDPNVPVRSPTYAPCNKDRFLGQCHSTAQCKNMYPGLADDCNNGEGGVCYLGTDVSGCLV